MFSVFLLAPDSIPLSSELSSPLPPSNSPLMTLKRFKIGAEFCGICIGSAGSKTKFLKRKFGCSASIDTQRTDANGRCTVFLRCADPEIPDFVETYYHGLIAMNAYKQWKKEVMQSPNFSVAANDVLKEVHIQQLEVELENLKNAKYDNSVLTIASASSDSNSFDSKERNLMKSQIEHMQKRIEQLMAVQEQVDPGGKLKLCTDRIQDLESKLAASQAEAKVFRKELTGLKKTSRNGSSGAPEAKIRRIEIKKEVGGSDLIDSLLKHNEDLCATMKNFGSMIDAVLVDSSIIICRIVRPRIIQ